MSYLVTSGAAGTAAIDEGIPGKPFELADALSHACRLIDQQTPNVAITDGSGNSISGHDLIACCNGDRKISVDLKAIVIPTAAEGQ
jgi:hypothetical protein